MKSFRSGGLPAAETIACAEHLEICLECGRVYDQISISVRESRKDKTDIAIVGFIAGEHLDYDRITEYLEGGLDEHEAASMESHMEMCDQCAEDLRALREFRRSYELELKQNVKPERSRWSDTFGSSLLNRPFPVLAAALVLLVIGLIILMIFFNRARQPAKDPREIVVTPTETPGLPHTPLPVPIEKERPGSGIMPKRPARRDSQARTERSILLTINDNGLRYGLDSEGRPAGLDGFPAEMRHDIARVLLGDNPGGSAELREWGDVNESVRGEGKNREILSLIGPAGIIIIEDRPLLRWSPVTVATGYVVDIVDDSFNLIARSPELKEPQWQIQTPLARDRVYLWQVNAYRDQQKIDIQPNPVAKFKVISQQELAETRRARKRYTSHLALAIFYAKRGLIGEAEMELNRLQADNPDSRLIDSVRRAIIP